jgi:predicted 3-demethylubiquinone-9 3-methyltransferase (glyoxalase superfamily)
VSATVTPFLMFEGRAEEAMQRYLSLFPDSRKFAWLNDEFGVSWQLNLP